MDNIVKLEARAGHLKSAQVKEVIDAGDIVLWRGDLYLLPLERWAGVVRDWLELFQMDVPEIDQSGLGAIRQAQIKAAIRRETLLVINLDRIPAAWAVPADAWWMARVQSPVGVHPDPAWLVSLGLRLPEGVMPLADAIRELGKDRSNVYTAARSGELQVSEHPVWGMTVEVEEWKRWRKEKGEGEK